ncbi:putative holin [Paraburkholderia adhaesiva]|uniref:putative holin n=1 Tax=Paraburkholderia adhaesiva TaxID=2883244 RepID=UPI001F394594|nr:putative holin [Paraburkholderia adhaesiva]
MPDCTGFEAALWAAASGIWSGDEVHGAIAVGNVCGAFVYLLETTESRRWRKITYAVISVVLGYGVAPWVHQRVPIMPNMLAGALASALIVGAPIAAFRQADKVFPSLASRIGAEARKRITGADPPERPHER